MLITNSSSVEQFKSNIWFYEMVSCHVFLLFELFQWLGPFLYLQKDASSVLKYLAFLNHKFIAFLCVSPFQYTDYVRYVEPCFRGTLVQADLDNREVRPQCASPLTAEGSHLLSHLLRNIHLSLTTNKCLIMCAFCPNINSLGLKINRWTGNSVVFQRLFTLWYCCFKV